ncbi:hypothetical protein [Pelovirga terrestris]|uniref:Uncharacterized protein n=1 Tax=Pelovirga terrestris TaxID=2771352 RepID=A0A8J6QQ47_9BACT|nr:hypothetical protein [Pelovirga terrestris]MBD1400886.1 hypothetical protein [Pelovirga terrestris]
MSCLKGKSKVKKNKAKYVCKKCEAFTLDKGDLCKPEKVEKTKGSKKGEEKIGKKKKPSK